MDQLIRNNTNFAFWKLPNQKMIHSIISKNKEDNTEKTEFLIRPFVPLLGKTFFSITEPNTTKTNHYQSIKPDTKDEYLVLVNKAIQSIKGGTLKKVVVSRIETHPKSSTKSIEKIFNQLCKSHPDSLVFCYHHQELGTWMGATPERLLSQIGTKYTTMALAGTKPKSDATPWTTKEIEEHNFVVKDLVHKIKHHQGTNITKHPQETILAGSVKHLQTRITFESTLPAIEIAEHFHPTPAVCGTPTISALNFISTAENHERLCYTGYLGIKNNEETHLFVNLRSMLITKDEYILFVGGGITKDSIPEAEWEETKNKAKTMLSVIENC